LVIVAVFKASSKRVLIINVCAGDMMIKEIFNFIISLLERHGPVPGESDNERMAYRYLDVAHIDSFGLNEFVMEIEDHFNVALSPKDTQSEEFRSVGGLVELIENRINAPQ
jgi:D-alanine--poly(phosphoribitol) ligase subunit 2